MDNIGKALPISLERLRERSKQTRGLEYRYLWVKVSFAVARDKHIREIGAQAFGIFMIIRTYMNKDSIAFPSLATIAYQSGCSVGTIQSEIKKLIEHNWLKKAGRINIKGKYGNTKYLIVERDLIRGTKDPSFMEKPIAKITNG